jgi:hypothetical protein
MQWHPPTDAAPRSFARWGAGEDAWLTLHWGCDGIDAVARRLRRTPEAVERRAAGLGLGTDRPTESLRALARRTGYSTTLLRRTADQLGLAVEWAARCHVSSVDVRRRARVLAFTEEQSGLILAHLGQVPDGQRRYRSERPGKSARGVWGVGMKPAACLGGCGSSRPHFARGKCKVCYSREFKEKKCPEPT